MDKSWDMLRSQLAHNPQRRKARPIMLAAMAATGAGILLVMSALISLFGTKAVPTALADFQKESTWNMLLGVLTVYITWKLFINGNSLFGLHRPAGHIFCFSSLIALASATDHLISTVAHPPAIAAALRDPMRAAAIAGALLIGVLLLRAGNVWFASARKYLTLIVRDPGDLRGLDYSLYLRTFELDDELSGTRSFIRGKWTPRNPFTIGSPEEMLITDALSHDDAPMIGVGRPGEPAPHVGAIRLYLPHADWRPQVRELIKGARHVTLALGWGEGTIWELREAMRILEPEQLILVVPMKESEYEEHRGSVADSLPVELPPYLSGRRELHSAVRGLITFSEGWEAAFVPVSPYSPLHNSLRMALIFAAWPALRRLGYPPRGVLRLAPNIIQ